MKRPRLQRALEGLRGRRGDMGAVFRQAFFLLAVGVFALRLSAQNGDFYGPAQNGGVWVPAQRVGPPQKRVMNSGTSRRGRAGPGGGFRTAAARRRGAQRRGGASGKGRGKRRARRGRGRRGTASGRSSAGGGSRAEVRARKADRQPVRAQSVFCVAVAPRGRGYSGGACGA